MIDKACIFLMTFLRQNVSISNDFVIVLTVYTRTYFRCVGLVNFRANMSSEFVFDQIF